MIQSLSQDLGAQSVILTISMHASQLVQADRCTVFLVNEGKKQLQSVCGDSGKEIKIPKSAGIAGQCAMEGQLIAIEDCYQDSRFNPAIDKQTGYKTTSMLVVPVLRSPTSTVKNCGKVLAVIQMINKMEFDGEVGKFDEEDLQVMGTCASFIASKLEGSALIEKISQIKDETEADAEAHGAFDSIIKQSEIRHHQGGQQHRLSLDHTQPQAIAEDEGRVADSSPRGSRGSIRSRKEGFSSHDLQAIQDTE
jgi:GAF domain-containing protein